MGAIEKMRNLALPEEIQAMIGEKEYSFNNVGMSE